MNDLAALSTEREDVFRAVHATWLRWAAAAIADGLRIDHPDGLFDPKQYLDRLQEAYRTILASGGRKPSESPLYVVVEKILGDGERVAGRLGRATGQPATSSSTRSTGCSWTRRPKRPITAFYRQFTGCEDPWPEIVYQSKRQVSRSSLASELNALAHQLDRIARIDRRSRDFTLNGIRKALREVIACFPVYRSYITTTVARLRQGRCRQGRRAGHTAATRS